MTTRGVSVRAEQSRLVESLRAEGRSRVEIATVVGQRFKVNPRVAFRLAHGWTQQQAADAWCQRWPDNPKTFKAVSRWEVWPAPSGHAPPFEVLNCLANLYQCTVSDLVADQADYRHLDPANRSQSLPARALAGAAAPGRSERGGHVVAIPAGYGGPESPVGVPLGDDVHAALTPLGHGIRQVMPVPGGTYFAGTEIEVDVFPALDDEVILAQVPDGYPSAAFRARSRRGLVVGAVPTDAGPAHYGVDTRWARRRLSGAGRGARLGIPAAYRLDEVTLGLLWAVSNLDDALLHDDRLIAEQRPALERSSSKNRSSAGRAAVDELNVVSAMWLGSDFCARHILRQVNATNWPAAFWTREQRGEECSAWLFFVHKLTYLERLAQRGPRADVTRTFCVPGPAVAESKTGERVLVFLAMALMESFGVRTRVVAAPEYHGLDGFALAGSRRAIVANWVGCDGIWLVDVTEHRPTVSAYADAIAYAAAHGLTCAAAPRQRLQMVADYLGLGWAAVARRCAELAQYGLTGLIDPRSRLLSTAGAERACRYVAELQNASGTGKPVTAPRRTRVGR